MIQAKAWSDDKAIEVSFDATPYFKSVASDTSILAIVKCGFRGDYATDNIALDYPSIGDASDIELKSMFNYIDVARRVRDLGFEVSVDPDDLLKWVQDNRTHLVTPITEYFRLTEDEEWEFPT